MLRCLVRCLIHCLIHCLQWPQWAQLQALPRCSPQSADVFPAPANALRATAPRRRQQASIEALETNMATYKVKAYGKEYTVEVIEQASGARIIVEGYSFEVEAAAPGSVPGQSVARPVAPAPVAAPAAAPAAPSKKAKAPTKAAAAAAVTAAPAAKPAASGRRSCICRRNAVGRVRLRHVCQSGWSDCGWPASARRWPRVDCDWRQ